MAMYSAMPSFDEDTGSFEGIDAPATPATHNASNTGIDIDAWTIAALQSLNVSPMGRGIGSPLAIPLDEAMARKRDRDTAPKAVKFDGRSASPPSPPQRPRSSRDSLAKREALLKGKEGSRQRRRWDNDHLVGVPNAQPPQPTDWHVQPTHPVRRMPYQVAQYWERGVRQQVQDKTSRLQATRKKQQLQSGSATGLGVGEVPRDLREYAKRSPLVKNWVRTLEEPVRDFLHGEGSRAAEKERQEMAAAEEELDSDEEEIVFAGRQGALKELQEKKDRWRLAHREIAQETVDSGMVFDSFGDDESAAYKRWLTHSISDYYGLESRSVTIANTSRKVVYVGFKKAKHAPMPHLKALPRPLWEAC